jgi:hypothetical protein
VYRFDSLQISYNSVAGVSFGSGDHGDSVNCTITSAGNSDFAADLARTTAASRGDGSEGYETWELMR